MDNYLLPEDDGLPTRVFGAWTTEKLDYVRRYIYMFETSMRGKPWRQRSYIDLYAGTGKYRAEENGEVHLGSALLALTTEHPFTHYYFVESDLDNLNTLKQRCQPATQEIRFYEGDANQKVNEIVNEITSGDKQRIPNQWSSLNLAFLDPDGLELEWKTVESLAKVNRMDLIIYYSQFGLNLNLKNCYQTKSETTTIDRFFGDSEWRRIFEKWKLKDSIAGIHRDLIDYYKSKLHTLGYIDVVEPETGVEPPMRTSKTKAPLYRLLFACKNELGHEFWKKVTRKDVWGQGRLL